MIPAPAGWTAIYKVTLKDGVTHWDHKDVVAFDEDGDAMVIDEAEARLVRARRYSNFEGLDRSGASVIATAPAQGWRAEFTYADGGTWTVPVAAWGFDAAGSGEALVPVDEGYYLEPVRAPKDGAVRVFHPDEVETKAPPT